MLPYEGTHRNADASIETAVGTQKLTFVENTFADNRGGTRRSVNRGRWS